MSKILIASDHAGFKLKTIIIEALEKKNYQVFDLGCNDETSVDYPEYAQKLCNAIDNKAKGILICGSGIGMSIAANRFANIRAALCTNKEMARLAIEHNNANVLVLGARIITDKVAFECLTEFLNSKFIGEKHQRRINKL